MNKKIVNTITNKLDELSSILSCILPIEHLSAQPFVYYNNRIDDVYKYIDQCIAESQQEYDNIDILNTQLYNELIRISNNINVHVEPMPDFTNLNIKKEYLVNEINRLKKYENELRIMIRHVKDDILDLHSELYDSSTNSMCDSMPGTNQKDDGKCDDLMAGYGMHNNTDAYNSDSVRDISAVGYMYDDTHMRDNSTYCNMETYNKLVMTRSKLKNMKEGKEKKRNELVSKCKQHYKLLKDEFYNVTYDTGIGALENICNIGNDTIEKRSIQLEDVLSKIDNKEGILYSVSDEKENTSVTGLYDTNVASVDDTIHSINDPDMSNIVKPTFGTTENVIVENIVQNTEKNTQYKHSTQGDHVPQTHNKLEFIYRKNDLSTEYLSMLQKHLYSLEIEIDKRLYEIHEKYSKYLQSTLQLFGLSNEHYDITITGIMKIKERISELETKKTAHFEILSLIEKRELILERMNAFEKIASDPRRLFKSSFQLNKEEKFRKSAFPNLLKIENTLFSKLEEYRNKYDKFIYQENDYEDSLRKETHSRIINKTAFINKFDSPFKKRN